MAARLQSKSVRGRSVGAAYATLGALAITGAAFIASGLGQQQMDTLSKSVVKIKCDNRVASGFIWPTPDMAVTALHAVSGCQRLSVYYEKLRIARDAQVVRVLRDADLSLVKISSPPTIQALDVANEDPKLFEDLIVLGYEQAAPTMSTQSMRVAYGPSTLKEMVNDQVRKEIQRIGIPSLELQILRLEGHLQPGLSGAPILNAAGVVVAVGDGGLEQGAASVSWAIRAADLQKLQSSREAIGSTQADVQVVSLFSAGRFTIGEDGEDVVNAPEEKAVRCGDISFTRVRRRPFQELALSSDDPVGLQQLLQLFHFVGAPEPNAMTPFDIYVNQESGATIAVPPGVTFEHQEGLCFVQSGAVRLYVISALGSKHAQELSRELMQDIGMTLNRDPAWSYPAVAPRFDGLQVFRSGYVGLANGGTKPGGYAFEAKLLRNGVFVGVVAVNYAIDMRLVQACQSVPSEPVCATVRQALAEWPYFLLAVGLSTFAIG